MALRDYRTGKLIPIPSRHNDLIKMGFTFDKDRRVYKKDGVELSEEMVKLGGESLIVEALKKQKFGGGK